MECGHRCHLLASKNLTYSRVCLLLLVWYRCVYKLANHVLKLQNQKMERTWIPESLPRGESPRDQKHPYQTLWELWKNYIVCELISTFELVFVSVASITLTQKPTWLLLANFLVWHFLGSPIIKLVTSATNTSFCSWLYESLGWDSANHISALLAGSLLSSANREQ
jgi:hypothetical protein